MKAISGKTVSYTLVPSGFGTVGIIWQPTETGAKVYQIVLPHEKRPAVTFIKTGFTDARLRSNLIITELGERIRAFLEGEAVAFSLGMIALERCSEFQRETLLAVLQIPRGWVSTYKDIAAYLGKQSSARAVGQAISRNPFPIIIPCHRALKSNGELGGFQGGIKMKRALLKLEEIGFSRKGKALTDRFYF